MSNAIKESIFYILISIIFCSLIYLFCGINSGNEWFTAYVIEKTLSVDNLFVMYLIFSYFNTPANLQHKCLFWGIIGVIIMRGICIIGGVTLLNMFHWLIYPLGALLLYSGVKIYFTGDDTSEELQENKIVKLFRKYFPVLNQYEDDKFFVKRSGHTMATVLFIVLLMIETTDIIFAMDSIPAALCISKNPLILYSSNIFAVLGLRALYFVLAEFVDKFWALKYGISIVLSFIGVKMLISNFFEISTSISLLITITTITLSIFISLTNKPEDCNV